MAPGICDGGTVHGCVAPVAAFTRPSAYRAFPAPSCLNPPARKIGVLVQLEGGSEDLARQLAMHISFAAPEYTSRGDVPEDVLAAERQIYLNSDEVQSKPEQAREKIVEGMLAKRFLAAAPGGALLEQAWIHDVSKTVRAALDGAGATVKAFARISVAGS